MKIGMDNQVATEPEEMARLGQNCHNVQTALGGLERVVLPAEIEQRLQMRRSIVTTKKLKAGRRLTVDDLDVKRPWTGIPPDRFNELVGRVLVKDIDSDTLILESDVESVENNEL